MKLTNNQYDKAKQALLIVVPAAITLIQGLGTLYKFDTAIITGTIALLATFGGVALNYVAGKYDGEEKDEETK